MNAAELRAWQQRHGYTYASAAASLGVCRATYANFLAKEGDLPRMLALACAAIGFGIALASSQPRG
ncbi:hypothetical protein KDH83_31470, partial [Achromobacter sp. Marseille-Q0513]|uniref:hypothetical protein n=1 Tax=Achromobacter sp. Marseille-Q0513 TaxID=2829161 RepID=UPI001B9CC620